MNTKPISRFEMMCGQLCCRKDDALSRFVVSDSAIEALKWAGLVFMTLDHVNRYVFQGGMTGLFEAGRLAFPLFGFVLAYNLARPGASARGVYGRTIVRLFVYGVIASPVTAALRGQLSAWWPLNVLFTLLAFVAVVYLSEQRGKSGLVAAAAVFVAGGFLVDYLWIGIAYCLTTYWFCKSPSKTRLALWMIVCVLLYVINHNYWGLAAIPLIALAPMMDFKVPRFKHVFYVYYPFHLVVIWMVVIFMK